MSKKPKPNAVVSGSKSAGVVGKNSGAGDKDDAKHKDKKKGKKKRKFESSADRSHASGTHEDPGPLRSSLLSDDDRQLQGGIREANILVQLLSELHAKTATLRAELEADGLEAHQKLSLSHNELAQAAQELEGLRLRLEDSREQVRHEVVASRDELTRAARELEALHLHLGESRAQARQELSASRDELTRAAQELEALHLRFEESGNEVRRDLESAVRDLRSAEQELRAARTQGDHLTAAVEPQAIPPGSSVAESSEPAAPRPPDEPAAHEGQDGVAEVSNEDGSTRGLRSVASGGAILWGGTVAFGASTAVLLAILSRHHSVNFSALSALLGLSFVMALVPSGVQLRAAALVADGFAVPRMSARFLATVTAVGFALSPLLGLVLRVPAVAVGLIVIQLVVALPLAARCGGLIGAHRFEALGVNMVIESAVRVGLGALGGLTLGIPGLAGGLAMGTIVALLALPSGPADSDAVKRPMTSLFNASITLVLLGFFVQMDVLMAPSGLSHSGATFYDLAALPSKGVYIVLLAAGPMIFPFVRRNASPKLILLAAGGTLLFGLLVTAVLLPLRHLIGILLDQATPSLLLMALLGSAMAAAGTTAVLLNAGVARGVARPWPPLVLGMISIAAVWASRPSATTFAVTVLGAQVGTMVLSACVTTMGRRGAVVASSRALVAEEPAPALPVALEYDDILSLKGGSPDADTSEPENTRRSRGGASWRHPSVLSRSLVDRPSRRGDREVEGRQTEAG